MTTNETENLVLKETTSANPQLSETPDKTPEAGLWARIKSKKKYIFTGIGIVTLAGVAYGIGSQKLAVRLPQLREVVVKQLPKELIDAALAEQALESVATETAESKRAYTRPTEPFIRTMAEWKHHSPAKAVQAAEMGIDLESYQTIVVFAKEAA